MRLTPERTRLSGTAPMFPCGVHEGRYDAGHRVGEGFLNGGMYGFGPRRAQYTPTSLVRVRIRMVPGSDPAQPFLVSAFPTGIM